MRLCCNEPRMIRKFYHLDNTSIRRSTAEFHAMFCEDCTEVIIYFVTMAVTFFNIFSAIQFVSFRSLVQNTWIRTKS